MAKSLPTYLIGLVLISWLSSCAAPYRTMNLYNVPYQNLEEQNQVEVSYRYFVLSQQNNRKYANRETKNQTYLAAVQVTNTGDTPITFGENATLVPTEEDKRILPPEGMFASLKQRGGWHAFYLAFGLIDFTFNGEAIPYSGLILGAVLSGGNLVVASTANQQFKSDLELKYHEGQTVDPGQTAQFLVGVTGISPFVVEKN